jgi:phosphatidate cytidylyltransferase
MLKQRILTAMVLIVATVGGILYLPIIGFAGVAAVLLALGAWEWSGLAGLTCCWQKGLYVLCSLLLLSIPFVQTYVLLSIALFGWIGAAIWVSCYPSGQRIWTSHVMVRLMLGEWLLVPCWVALLLLRQQSTGITLVFLLLILVWSADTGAYFVGRFFGKKPLAPRVSPNKTQEGVYGGILSALLITLGLGWFWLGAQMSFSLYAVLLLATILLSVLGDLFESMVKRMAGVKDSGSLLPGHGGVLDRLDGLLAAAPIFTVGIALIFRLNG